MITLQIFEINHSVIFAFFHIFLATCVTKIEAITLERIIFVSKILNLPSYQFEIWYSLNDYELILAIQVIYVWLVLYFLSFVTLPMLF